MNIQTKEQKFLKIIHQIKNQKVNSLTEISGKFSREELEEFATQIARVKKFNPFSSLQVSTIWLYGSHDIDFWANLILSGLGYQKEDVFQYQGPGKILFDLGDIDKKVVWLRNFSPSYFVPFTSLTDSGFRLETKGDFFFQSNFNLILITSTQSPSSFFSTYNLSPEAFRRIFDGFIINIDNKASSFLKQYNQDSEQKVFSNPGSLFPKEKFNY